MTVRDQFLYLQRTHGFAKDHDLDQSCNTSGSTQGLARWLLMYRDRLRSDQLPVTHEYMAAMLGVQRTGVTAALHELEGLGLISSRRGLVSIVDATELAALADGGYGVTEEHHAKLFRVRPTAQISTRDDDVEVIELPLIAAEQRVPGEYERLEP